MLNVPASTLTGGNWKELTIKNGKLLIAHLRPPAPLSVRTVASAGSLLLCCLVPRSHGIRSLGPLNRLMIRFDFCCGLQT